MVKLNALEEAGKVEQAATHRALLKRLREQLAEKKAAQNSMVQKQMDTEADAGSAVAEAATLDAKSVRLKLTGAPLRCWLCR
jgi:hypothetical protein